MSALLTTDRGVTTRILDHLLRRIDATPAQHEPFAHIYLEDVLPADVYAGLLAHLPDPALYVGTAERHHGHGAGGYTRSQLALTPPNLARLPDEARGLYRSLGAALTAPELKRAMFAKLAKDLAFRYGIEAGRAPGIEAYARPTLYRETDGFEIPPHPDTRKKIVTMHLYWPEDRSQLELGTALYRRRLLANPLGGWQGRFAKVKQFPFQPNSGYAFVVNNTLTKKSWHGRERLPAGSGVRNTLLNTFYESAREGFGDY